MDDHLVARWRRGDSRAAPVLRRHLSVLATHLWTESAPRQAGMGFHSTGPPQEDPQEVRVRVAGVIRQAMAGDAQSASALKDRCVRATARQRVNALLAQDGGEHPAADLLVVHGLQGDLGRGPEEIEQHLPLCAACTEALRTITHLRRVAAQWSPDEDVSDDPTDPTPRRRRRRTRPKRTERYPWPSPFSAWPVALLLGLLFWWGYNRSAGQEVIEANDRFRGIVDRTPPEAPPASVLPAIALDAVRDLRRGDCISASARLRSARRKVPGHVELRMLEGETFICVGNGVEAMDAVVGLEGQVRSGEIGWILARAHLLLGQPDPARRYLGDVIQQDARLRGRAQALLARVSEVEAQR